jgi:hypothetical protein
MPGVFVRTALIAVPTRNNCGILAIVERFIMFYVTDRKAYGS